MAKKNRKKPKYQKANVVPLHLPKKKVMPLEPRNQRQAQFLSNLKNHDLNFALGPAGTGKTYCATRYACKLFEDRRIDKIIVTRPMVSSEEDPGYLPGTLEDKFAPFFAPVREILEEHLGKGQVAYLLKSGQIEIAPLAYLRGHTFKNCFVIFDECQNTTELQMKMFLTRIGEGAQVCLAGDDEQIDRPSFTGLSDAVWRLGKDPEIGVIEFRDEDITRSRLAQKIVEGYRK